MKVTQVRSTIAQISDAYGGGHAELVFTPHDEDNVLAERVDDKLVLAYTVYDETAESPFESSDCQGNLYVSDSFNRAVKVDQANFLSYLCLDSDGRVNPYNELVIKGVTRSLWGHAVHTFHEEMDDEDFEAIIDRLHSRGDIELSELQREAFNAGDVSYQMLTHLKDRYKVKILAELEDENGYFDARVWDTLERIYSDNWTDIVGDYVVPVSVTITSYGSEYEVSSWDGDPQALPDAVWVADKGAKENIGKGVRFGTNIKFTRRPWPAKPEEKAYWVILDDLQYVKSFPTYEEAARHVEEAYQVRPLDVRTGASNYADGVLEEYSRWTCGEVFGCVAHVYSQNGSKWELLDRSEECWGFIGKEYAMEALVNEFFEPTVKRLRREAGLPENGSPLLAEVDDSEGGLTD